MRFTELLRARVAKLVWLYAVWTLLWALAFQVIPLYRGDQDRGNPLLVWLTSFVWPNESTWFVYALAAYFILAWVMRPLPAAVQLGLAALLAAVVGSGLVSWENGALRKSCMYFVFYLAAVHLSARVRALAPRVPWYAVIGLVLVYAGALVVVLRAGAMAVPGVRLALGVVGVALGVAVSVWLSRLRAFHWVEMLGSRTLQIYFVHFYVVLGAVALLAPIRGQASAVQLIWVPLVTVLAVLVSLVVHRLTRRVPGLWDLPRRTRGASAGRTGEPRDHEVHTAAQRAGSLEEPADRDAGLEQREPGADGDRDHEVEEREHDGIHRSDQQ